MRYFTSFLMIIFSDVVFSAEQKQITSLTNEPIGVSNYLQMFFGLFVIVVVIFGMAWLMRRMGNLNSKSSANLKILGGLSVGQRERVVLVQAGETQLLVGVAPGQVRMLHVLDETIETDSPTDSNTPSGFSEKLHAAIKSRSK